MVTMTVEPTREPIDIAHFLSGSGRFFIAAQPLTLNATLYATDRYLTCVHMTALNKPMRNDNAVIVHGKMLSLVSVGRYVTRYNTLGGVM